MRSMNYLPLKYKCSGNKNEGMCIKKGKSGVIEPCVRSPF
jgi:hypothetical protein